MRERIDAFSSGNWLTIVCDKTRVEQNIDVEYDQRGFS